MTAVFQLTFFLKFRKVRTVDSVFQKKQMLDLSGWRFLIFRKDSGGVFWIPEKQLRKLFEKRGLKKEFEEKFLYLNSNAELAIDGYSKNQDHILYNFQQIFFTPSFHHILPLKAFIYEMCCLKPISVASEDENYHKSSSDHKASQNQIFSIEPF